MFIMRLIGRWFHKPVDKDTKFKEYRRFRCGNHRTHDGTDGCGYEFEHHDGDRWYGPFNSPVRPMETKYVYLLGSYGDCMDNLVDIGPVLNRPTNTRVRSGRR